MGSGGFWSSPPVGLRVSGRIREAARSVVCHRPKLGPNAPVAKFIQVPQFHLGVVRWGSELVFVKQARCFSELVAFEKP